MIIQKKNNNLRDSRIELLRIIAAIMILSHHIIQHSGNMINGLIQSPLSVNQFATTLFGSWGQLGVSIFVIITSWFSINNRGVRILPILKIIVETWIYCILISCVYMLIGIRISFRTLIEELLTPLYPRNYWFITTYILFCFIIPILREGLYNISEKLLKGLCVSLILMVPVYNIFYQNPGPYLADFCTLFVLTFYFKRNPNCLIEKYRKLILCISLICSVSCTMLLCIVGTQFNNQTILNQMVRFHDNRNILTFIQAFAIFFVFINIRSFKPKIINLLSQTSLAVYIISENILIRGDGGTDTIWETVFRLRSLFNSDACTINFIFNLLLTIVFTFIAVFIIDFVRIQLEKHIFSIGRIKKLIYRIESFFTEEEKDRARIKS